MNFTVEHLGLAAHNPVTLKDWYVKTLDAKVVFDNGQTPPAFFLSLPGGLLLEIYRSDLSLKETGINSLAGWRHIALQVDSVEIAKAMLEARGVSFTEPVKPAGGGGSVLFFRDAEDNLLHLVERPAGSPFLAQA
jgi:glyoxylase I family protein